MYRALVAAAAEVGAVGAEGDAVEDCRVGAAPQLRQQTPLRHVPHPDQRALPRGGGHLVKRG